MSRASFLVSLWFVVSWGPAVGRSVTPANPCDSEIFEVQFKAVCPVDNAPLEKTFEEARHPLLTVRLKGPTSALQQTVWASFGFQPLRFPEVQKSLFTLKIEDSRIFDEKSRQKVQLTYLKNTTAKEIEISACDDPKEECTKNKTSLVPQSLVFRKCEVPPVVVLPVFAGCR